MFKCPNCDYEIDSINSLRIHCAKIHKISSEDLYLKVVSDGIKPICKCGCGKNTSFQSLTKGYNEFLQGHVARIKNNWGHNSEAFEKSIKTRRRMWETGEIRGWCAGLTKEDPRVAAIIEKMNTPERADKISKSLKGKKKSDDHKKKIAVNMSAYWSIEENRSKQSLRQAECVKNGMITKATRVHGYYKNPKKSNCDIYYRSLFELNAIIHLENNENIKSYKFEPFRIKYDYEEKVRYYIIDCLIEYQDNQKSIIEIKPNCHIRDPKNQSKFLAAKEFADKNCMTFEVWTEKTHPFLADSLGHSADSASHLTS